ncbi:MAG TPA: DUF4157 domain-containing protein, partial [Ilumatobacteraceae bacterium]|nr:DUF4157 domain-containing protein [Ilumatobacteraceae bacterium]
GSTSTGEARTILAHELTHVAQQRRLGASLPDESSPAGAALESEARSVAGQGPPVPTRPMAPSPAAPAPQRLPGEPPSRHVRALPHDRADRSPDRPPGAMSPMDVVARVQAAASAAGIAAPPPAAEAARHVAPAPSPPTAAPSDRSSSTVASSTVQRLPGDGDVSPSTTSSVATTSSNTDTPTPTPNPSDDPAQLEELARRLYPRFRTRLRQDLLADRERSGRLFDVR